MAVRIDFIRDIKALIEEALTERGTTDVGVVKDVNQDGTFLIEIEVPHDWSGDIQKMSLRDVPAFANVGDISTGDRVALMYVDGDLTKPCITGTMRYGSANKDQDIVRWVMALKTIGAN